MALVQTKAENREKRSGLRIAPGTYVGVVMNNKDSRYAGRLEVWVSSFGGSPADPMTWKIVSYANPFYGITPFAANKQVISDQSSTDAKATAQPEATANSQQEQEEDVKSFGMWVQPPEVGTRVLVTFTEGDDQRGFWFAAIPELAHGMIPAIGKGESGKPEVEFDPSLTETINEEDLHKVKRKEFEDEIKKFETQGLQEDEYRGFVTSSSFRESPSKVMGFNTPSGHSLVMDDGDADGKSKIIRIRTSGGNQITLNDDTGMIYLINSQGTGWMELSPTGYLDVYAEAGINMATKKDINLHADNDINIHAGNNLKMVAMKGAKLQGTEELQLHGKKTMIEGVDGVHIHSCTEILVTSFKDIYMKAFQNFVLQGKCWRWNSGNAKEAEQVPPETPTKVSDYDTTVNRAPQHEPYKEHDNGSQGGAAGAGAPGVGGGGIDGLLPGMSQNPANLFGAPTGGGGAGGINLPGMSQNPANLIGTPTTSTNPRAPVTATGTVVNSRSQANPAKILNGATKISSGAGASGTAVNPTNIMNAVPSISTGGGAAAGAGINGILSGMSQNPANLFGVPAGAGDPIGMAAQALNGFADMPPTSNIPAGAGGGKSGFATGDNCARPSGFGNGGGGGPGGVNNAPVDPNYIAPGYPEDMTQAEIEGVIRQEAALRGMDPETAVAIYRAEGAGGYQSGVPRTGPGSVGGREASYGPYQLYTGGGLGNEYQKATGRNLATDNNRVGITKQVQFSLDKAATNGWGAWYGRIPAGVGVRDGLSGARPIGNWK